MIPKLVGHRGYMGKYPENSLSGIEAALKAGACMVEFDVQMSADHELVVVHDADLQRTSGIAGSVFDLSVSELTQASVHEPERFGDKYLGALLPTLKQVMELVAEYPDVTAFVEIKRKSLKHWGLKQVIDALHDSLKDYASQCVIISFGFDAVSYAKQHGLYSVGWVLENYDEPSHEMAMQLKPDYLICDYLKIPDGVEPWKGPWSWMLYDIIDPNLALQWAARGVEIIETEDIGGMLEHKDLRKESC